MDRMLHSKVQELTDIELECQNKLKRRLVSSEGIHGEAGELNVALVHVWPCPQDAMSMYP